MTLIRSAVNLQGKMFNCLWTQVSLSASHTAATQRKAPKNRENLVDSSYAEENALSWCQGSETNGQTEQA